MVDVAPVKPSGSGELTKPVNAPIRKSPDITGLLRRLFEPKKRFELPELTAQRKAELLYDHCVSSGIKVGENVHTLYAIGRHYQCADSEELEQPEVINGIPPFFASLSREDKANYCFNKVTEALSAEAKPVTIESLLATRRAVSDDPSSSFAGRFVRRVSRYVTISLAVILFLHALYLFRDNLLGPNALPAGLPQLEWLSWVAFGCIGALVHLLNHALTTTRLNTFQLSEERKVWPRILLGGMFGFVLPWLLSQADVIGQTGVSGAGTIAAFFGGYSVRFSIGLLERVLAAVFPETKPPK